MGAEAPAARLRFDIGILLPFWRFDRFFDMGLLRPDFTCVALIHHCGKKRACVLSECFAFLIHICVCFELRFRLALILLGFCVSHFYFRLGCWLFGKGQEFNHLDFEFREDGLNCSECARDVRDMPT